MVFGWGKKRQERPEPQAAKPITIQDIPGMLESIKESESTRLVEQHKNLYLHVREHVRMLLDIASDLEKDELKTDDIDVNITTIVKRGKKQVLHIIHKEAQRRLTEIDSADQAKEFNKAASHMLARIGDVLGKQTRVIHIFAKRHANRLKDILGEFKQDVEHSNRLLQRYTKFEEKYAGIVQLLNTLDADAQSVRDNQTSVAELKGNAADLQSRISDLGKKTAEFESASTYKSYLDLKSELDAHNETRSQVESRIKDHTILISRPISKYSYGSSLDKEYGTLIEKIIHSPFDVFLESNKDGITTILDGVKKAITLGHMSVKEPQKTLGYIDAVESKTDEFIRMVESFLSTQKSLQDKIDRLDISCLDSYKAGISKASGDYEFLQSRIRELKGETESLIQSRPENIREIQILLNQISDARYIVEEQ